jgi:hypothetical protein
VFECIVKHQMLGCAGQPFLPTDNMRNLHFYVINDIGEMISGPTVTLNKYEVIKVLMFDRYYTINCIPKGYALALISESKSVWLTLIDFTFPF